MNKWIIIVLLIITGISCLGLFSEKPHVNKNHNQLKLYDFDKKLKSDFLQKEKDVLLIDNKEKAINDIEKQLKKELKDGSYKKESDYIVKCKTKDKFYCIETCVDIDKKELMICEYEYKEYEMKKLCRIDDLNCENNIEKAISEEIVSVKSIISLDEGLCYSYVNNCISDIVEIEDHELSYMKTSEQISKYIEMKEVYLIIDRLANNPTLNTHKMARCFYQFHPEFGKSTAENFVECLKKL